MKAAFAEPKHMPPVPPQTKFAASPPTTKALLNGRSRSAPNSSSKLVQCHRKPHNPILQACCWPWGGGKEEAETDSTHLLHPGPSYTTLETPDFGPTAPQLDQVVSVNDWKSYDGLIFNVYPVYYKVISNSYIVIATTRPDISGNAKVVANSSLESKPHKSDKKIYFTSFDSNPPFAGLGRIALTILKQNTGKDPVPSGPVPGAYAAYHGMGMKGFKIGERVLSDIKNLTEEARKIKSHEDFNIEDQMSRDALRGIQNRIKDREMFPILHGRMKFDPE
jgi:hypothetical protein